MLAHITNTKLEQFGYLQIVARFFVCLFEIVSYYVAPAGLEPTPQVLGSKVCPNVPSLTLLGKLML